MSGGLITAKRLATLFAPTPLVAPETDLLDPPALAARQRAARRMADGVRETFLTSSRGLEAPAGAGLKAPESGDDVPIITDMTGRDMAAFENADQAMRDARDRKSDSSPPLIWSSGAANPFDRAPVNSPRTKTPTFIRPGVNLWGPR